MSHRTTSASKADKPTAPGSPAAISAQRGEAVNYEDSPLWSMTTKAIVASAGLILISLVVWRFQFLLTPLVSAAVLAYLLNPLIAWLRRKTGISRTSAVLVVYALILALLGWAGTVGALAVASRSTLLWSNLPTLLPNVVAQVQQRFDEIEMLSLTFGPYTVGLQGILEQINWAEVEGRIRNLLQTAAARSGIMVAGIFQRTLSTLGDVFLILILSIYLAIDAPRIGGAIGNIAQAPGYRRDADRLVEKTLFIWNSYLRGQVILGLIIGTIVYATLSLLGVNNAVELGLLSGLLEFLPIIGPVVGAGAAVIVALLQNSNQWGLSPWIFALIVLVAMILIQQIEGAVLVPRIVGDTLDLHPIVVMVGVLAGSSLGGLLGAILAAPVLASFSLYGKYVWQKLMDLPPFEDDEVPKDDSASQVDNGGLAGLISTLWHKLIRWVDELWTKRAQ